MLRVLSHGTGVLPVLLTHWGVAEDDTTLLLYTPDISCMRKQTRKRDFAAWPAWDLVVLPAAASSSERKGVRPCLVLLLLVRLGLI